MSEKEWLVTAANIVQRLDPELVPPTDRGRLLRLVAVGLQEGYSKGWFTFAQRLEADLAHDRTAAEAVLNRNKPPEAP